jgi:hypothetical protein
MIADNLIEPRPRRPFHRFLWKGASLIVLAAVAGLVVAPQIVPVEQDAGAPQAMGGDFLVAYSAATLANEGQFEALHDSDTLMARIRSIAAANGLPPDGGTVGPWLNPPFYLLPFMALTKLPYETALLAWTAITTLSIAAASALLGAMLATAERARRLKLAGEQPGARWAIWILVPVLTAVSMPAVQTLTHGQSSGVSLLLLTGAVALWRKGHAFWAGALLGLLFYKPQLGMVVAAVMILDLGRRAFLGLLTTGAILAAVSALLMPEELWLYLKHFPSAAALMQAQGVFPWHRHATSLAFWRLLFQGTSRGPTAPLVMALGALTSVAMVLPLLLGIARHRRPALLLPRGDLDAIAVRRDRVIAATIAAMPLVMPYYMDYDLLLLAVPAVLFARELLHATGELTATDLWTRRAWVLAFLWMYPSAGFASTNGVNLNVPLLTIVAAMLVMRSTRHAAGTQRQSWAPPVARLELAA